MAKIWILSLSNMKIFTFYSLETVNYFIFSGVWPVKYAFIITSYDYEVQTRRNWGKKTVWSVKDDLLEKMAYKIAELSARQLLQFEP